MSEFKCTPVDQYVCCKISGSVQVDDQLVGLTKQIADKILGAQQQATKDLIDPPKSTDLDVCPCCGHEIEE